MSPVEVRVRFVVGETSDLAAEATDKLREVWAIKFLRGRGFDVAAPNEKWETPKQFQERIGRSPECLRRILKRPGCPNVAIHFSPNKRRILKICSNAAFDAFAQTHKTPEKKPEHHA